MKTPSRWIGCLVLLVLLSFWLARHGRESRAHRASHGQLAESESALAQPLTVKHKSSSPANIREQSTVNRAPASLPTKTQAVKNGSSPRLRYPAFDFVVDEIDDEEGLRRLKAARAFREGRGLKTNAEIRAFLRYYTWRFPNNTVTLTPRMQDDNPLASELRGEFHGELASVKSSEKTYETSLTVDSTTDENRSLILRLQVRITIGGLDLPAQSVLDRESQVKFLPASGDDPPMVSVQLNPGSTMQLFFDRAESQWIGNLYLTDKKGAYQPSGMLRLNRVGE